MTTYESVSLEPYIEVENGKAPSFGGSQTWFDKEGKIRDRWLHLSSCGLIAACDFLIYFCRSRDLRVKWLPESVWSEAAVVRKKEYMAFLRRVARRGYPIIPRVGSIGPQIPLYLNHFLRKHRQPYRLFFLWKNTKKKRLRIIDGSIRDGLPVILVIGPHFMKPGSKNGVTFYRRSKDGVMTAAYKNIYRHFVTITGIYDPPEAASPLYLEISSWGQRLYIDYDELSHYITKESMPWFSGIYFVKKERIL